MVAERQADEAITLHSSWRGVVGSFAGATLLAVIGLSVLASNGLTVVSGLLTFVGVGVLFGVAFDYPIASTFDGDGVVRRALLRRHRMRWDEVRQLTRARPGVVAGMRGLVPGGLVALVGRRRYLLVDQTESGAEYDQLEELLGDLAEALSIDTLRRPPDTVNPTWVYRRAHWHRTR